MESSGDPTPGDTRGVAGAGFVPSATQAAGLAKFRDFLASADSSVFILTGAAGTGKTEMISEFCRCLLEVDLQPVVLAPTGQAARRLARRTGRAARTIHAQVFGLGDVRDRGDDDAPQTVFPIVLVEKPPMDAVYIIDESSLISNEPLDATGKEHAEMLFGTTNLLADILTHVSPRKVVFVGDPNQLPPIGLDVSPALDASTFEQMGLGAVAHDLSEMQRRDAHSPITDIGWRLSESIRTGQADANLEVRHQPENGIEIFAAPRLEIADLPAFLSGAATVVSPTHVSVAHWNGAIRREARRPLDMPCPGDRLILAKACLKPFIQNGEEIEVLGIDVVVDEVVEVVKERAGPRTANVRIAHGLFRMVGSDDPESTFAAHFVLDGCYSLDRDRQSVIRRVLWIDFLKRAARVGLTKRDGRIFWDFYAADPRVQAILASYSYARTIHKSQGGEWDFVVTDLSAVRGRSSRSRRLSYTAVTRAKERLAIYAWPFSARFIDLDAIGATIVDRLRQVLFIDAQMFAIQYGRQLRSSSDNLLINIYERDRRLGGINLQKCPEERRDEVDNVLREVELEVRSSLQGPVEPVIVERSERLGAMLFERGFDLFVWSPGDYQVAFAVRSGMAEAVLAFHHNAAGELGKRLALSGGTDAVLAELLQSAIEEVWRAH
jgi:hypothetical protein